MSTPDSLQVLEQWLDRAETEIQAGRCPGIAPDKWTVLFKLTVLTPIYEDWARYGWVYRSPSTSHEGYELNSGQRQAERRRLKAHSMAQWAQISEELAARVEAERAAKRKAHEQATEHAQILAQEQAEAARAALVMAERNQARQEAYAAKIAAAQHANGVDDESSDEVAEDADREATEDRVAMEEAIAAADRLAEVTQRAAADAAAMEAEVQASTEELTQIVAVDKPTGLDQREILVAILDGVVVLETEKVQDGGYAILGAGMKGADGRMESVELGAKESLMNDNLVAGQLDGSLDEGVYEEVCIEETVESEQTEDDPFVEDTEMECHPSQR